MADFLETDADHYLQLPAFYEEKRDAFAAMMKDSRFQLKPSPGTYFQLGDYSGITTERDVDYARRLTIEAKVASIPVSVFYESPPEQHLLRFCFAKDTNTLERATEILCRI